MRVPAAKGGDRVVGVDTHVIIIQGVPTPTPLPFDGEINEGLSQTVFIDNQGVAVVGSVANNAPQHIAFGGTFQTPPSNRGVISAGSACVIVDNLPVARSGDPVTCCNDPVDKDTGYVIATGTLEIT